MPHDKSVLKKGARQDLPEVTQQYGIQHQAEPYRPTNQPNNRPTNQPTNQQPTNRPTDRPTNHPANRPINQPTDQSTNQPASQSLNQPIDYPNNQSIDQSMPLHCHIGCISSGYLNISLLYDIQYQAEEHRTPTWLWRAQILIFKSNQTI